MLSKILLAQLSARSRTLSSPAVGSVIISPAELVTKATSTVGNASALLSMQSSASISSSLPFNDSSTPLQTYIRISHLFQSLILPVIIFTGIFGGILTVMLIRNDNILRKLPSNRYLMALAIFCAIFSLNLTFRWLEIAFKVRVLAAHGYVCKTVNFITNTADLAAAWCIVGISAERFVLFYCPNQRDRFCTQKTVITIIISITVISILWNSSSLIITDIRYSDLVGGMVCDIDDVYDRLYFYLNLFDIVVSSLIPSALVFGFNFALVSQFRKAVVKNSLSLKKEQQQNGSTDNAMLSSLNNKSTTATATVAIATVELNSRQTVGNMQVAMIRSKKWTFITRSLLYLTTSFVLMLLPCYLYRFVTSLWGIEIPYEDMTEMIARLAVELVVYLFYYAHHSLTFYIYCFHSPEMRKRLMPTCLSLMLCECCGFLPNDAIAV